MTPMDRFEDWLVTLPFFVLFPLVLLFLMLGLLVAVGLAVLVVVVATGGAGELVRYTTVFAVGLGAGLLVGRKMGR